MMAVLAPALACASEGSTVLNYALASLVAFLLGLLLLYASILAYRWVRGGGQDRGEVPEFAAEPSQSAFDVHLMDVVRLPGDLVIYFLRLGERVILVGNLGDGVTCLGDFPLGWVTDASPSERARQVVSQRYGQQLASPDLPHPRVPQRRTRREWEEHRRALIEALQREQEQ